MNCLGTSEYKIILLGEVGVGKTTFFLRIRDGEFVDTSTVGRSTAMRMRLHVQPQLSYSLKLKDGVEVKVKVYCYKHILQVWLSLHVQI